MHLSATSSKWRNQDGWAQLLFWKECTSQNEISLRILINLEHFLRHVPTLDRPFHTSLRCLHCHEKPHKSNHMQRKPSVKTTNALYLVHISERVTKVPVSFRKHECFSALTLNSPLHCHQRIQCQIHQKACLKRVKIARSLALLVY